ncbi:MAG: glucose-6-phosphate isomerase [Candidatus Staskawiczbacteria bacterium]|nr:glucose-6-phosphate isomerase [Candidatus Staskawiczbacteria bacterium]
MKFDLSKLTPDIRHLDDMREVLADKDFAKNSPNTELYYMYRGIEKKGELRYDITVIPAKMLGNEFNKTKGHYHIGAHQEIYTVLEGSAIYLLQKPFDTAQGKHSQGQIEDVYAVEAKKGDSVIMPSFYGHVTINPSKTQELKMANWVSENCKSDYSPFVKMQGACYYYTQKKWTKNENYKSIPELRFEKPLKALPQNLDFLKNK